MAGAGPSAAGRRRPQPLGGSAADETPVAAVSVKTVLAAASLLLLARRRIREAAHRRPDQEARRPLTRVLAVLGVVRRHARGRHAHLRSAGAGQPTAKEESAAALRPCAPELRDAGGRVEVDAVLQG